MKYITLETRPKFNRTQKKNHRKKLLFGFLACVVVVAIFFPKIWPKIIEVFTQPASVVQFIFDDSGGIASTNGRTNVLLLGTGGPGHQGGNLTDTIIVASVDVKNNDVVFISLPRDIWSENLKAKINAAYEFGEEKDEGSGLDSSKETIGELLDLSIHYAVRVDFSGFVRAVDQVGGIDIDVKSSFDDFQYPIGGKEDDTCGFTITQQEIEGQITEVILDATGSAIPTDIDPFKCRYEYLHFDQGQAHMDGEVALQYVRSRMGTNSEGSDFARSKRQQKVILAFKDKVFSTEILTDVGKLLSLAKTFGDSIETDISSDKAPAFIKLVDKMRNSQSRSFEIDNVGTDALLVNPPLGDFEGQWVLVPPNNDWSKIQQKLKEFLIVEKESKN
ncbi:MAG TPA: LCP family protein [Patescibacteria group bacterium]